MTGQEQAQSDALAPAIAEVRGAVQQADAVNLDESGQRQERHGPCYGRR